MLSINSLMGQASLRFSLILLISFLLYVYLPGSEKYWIILTVLALSQLKIYSRKDGFFLIVLASGMAANVFIANLVSVNIILLGCYLSLSTFIAVFYGLKNPHYFKPLFYINFFALISGGLTVSMHGGLIRSGMIELGAGIVLLVNAFSFIKRNVLQKVLQSYFYQANTLQQILFSIYLQRDYGNNRLNYEKKIHHQLSNVFESLGLLRKHASEEIVSSCEKLTECLISLGNLRYRIKDHATFEVCDLELRKISNELSKLFNHIMIGRKLNVMDYKHAIKKFKKNYENTLTLITNEPVYFLIFIETLLDIKKELDGIKHEPIF